jgi:hypothetical protein
VLPKLPEFSAKSPLSLPMLLAERRLGRAEACSHQPEATGIPTAN